MTLCSIGPRQMTGLSPGFSRPIEIIFTPCAFTGIIRCSGVAIGSCVEPSIIGTFGPYTSASSKPTLLPNFASASARFTATVVFPTPPFPLATATRFFTPGIPCLCGAGCCPGIVPGGMYPLHFLNLRRILRVDSYPWSVLSRNFLKSPNWPELTSHFFTPRGTSCTFCQNRTGRDHCVPPSHPHALASELPPAPLPSETASLSAGVPAVFPAHAQNPAISVPEALLHAPRRWLLLQPHSVGDDAAAPAEVPLTRAEGPRPAESARDRDTGSFRYRFAPSCLQTR